MLYEKSLNPLFINIIRLSHPQASGKTLLRDTCLQMLLKMRMAQIKKACPQMLSVPRGAVPSWLSLFPKEIGRDQAILYAIPGAGWCRDTGVGWQAGPMSSRTTTCMSLFVPISRKNGHPGMADRFRGYRQKTAGPGLRKSALMSLC